MRYFCNFSLVSLGIRPRSCRCAERTRQGEGRWSRPPKPVLERSYLTESSSSANRILRPRQSKTPDRIPKTKNDFIDYIYVCITVGSTIVPLYHMYREWFADGWLGQGCWYLWLIECLGKFSLPECGLLFCFFAL